MLPLLRQSRCRGASIQSRNRVSHFSPPSDPVLCGTQLHTDWALAVRPAMGSSEAEVTLKATI